MEDIKGYTRKLIKCPTCGVTNTGTEAYCKNCGEHLRSVNKSWILALSPAGLAASFFTVFTLAVAKEYPFLWGLLPLPWIALGIAWKWHIIGAVIFILLNALPFISGIVIQHMNSEEILGVVLAFLYSIPLYVLPLLTSAIILIVWRLTKHASA